VILGIILLIATLGGIGGSPAILPLTLIFFQMTMVQGMAHTSLFTFIGMFVRVIYELVSTNKHIPLRKINFHLSIMAAPVSCLGSYIGVKFNVNAPKIVVLTILTLISCYLVYLSFLEYRKKIKTEAEASKKQSLYVETKKTPSIDSNQRGNQQIKISTDLKEATKPINKEEHF
jgi:uncharacterized membrane protein YfcA